MTFSIATVADKLNIWDKLSVSPESPLIPCAPVYTCPSTETPLWTCWAGNFEILAVLYPKTIQLINRKDYISDVIETGSSGNGTLTMGYKSNKTLYYSTDKVIKIYDIQNKKELNSLTGHSSTIKTLSVSNDDQRIVSGAIDGSVMIHSLKHGTKSRLNSPFKQAVNQVAFYHFKKSQLIAGGDDGHISVWDLNNNMDPITVKKDVHLGPITGLAYAPCNKQLYCSVGLDKSLVFHDVLQSKKSVLSFTADQGLTSVSINDDHCAAVGTLDGKVMFYDIRWKGSIFTLDLHSQNLVSSVAFQPPQWAIESSSKESLVLSRSSNLSPLESQAGSDNIMGIFSPVNKKIVNMKSNDLRKTSLLNKMLAMKKETQEQDKSLECLQEAKELVKDMPMSSSETIAAAAEPSPAPLVSPREASVTHPTASTNKSKTSLEHRPKRSGLGDSDFQYQVLENIVHDSLESFAQDLKQDIQNMHIELLRQFQSQKKELKEMFSEFMPNSVLLEELNRLREENLRLKVSKLL